MDKKGRQEVVDLIEQLYLIKHNLEEIMDIEQDKYDNLPDGIRDSERGDTFAEIIDHTYSAVCSIDDSISELEELM